MKPHQERVVEERRKLDEDRKKLEEFLHGPEPAEIDPAERERLHRQELIMQLFSQVLFERINAF